MAASGEFAADGAIHGRERMGRSELAVPADGDLRQVGAGCGADAVPFEQECNLGSGGVVDRFGEAERFNCLPHLDPGNPASEVMPREAATGAERLIGPDRIGADGDYLRAAGPREQPNLLAW